MAAKPRLSIALGQILTGGFHESIGSARLGGVSFAERTGLTTFIQKGMTACALKAKSLHEGRAGSFPL